MKIPANLTFFIFFGIIIKKRKGVHFMKILALDLSTKSSGYAIGSD
jgi:hypothetical protein